MSESVSECDASRAVAKAFGRPHAVGATAPGANVAEAISVVIGHSLGSRPVSADVLAEAQRVVEEYEHPRASTPEQEQLLAEARSRLVAKFVGAGHAHTEALSEANAMLDGLEVRAVFDGLSFEQFLRTVDAEVSGSRREPGQSESVARRPARKSFTGVSPAAIAARSAADVAAAFARTGGRR